jgi:hypothetical protein
LSKQDAVEAGAESPRGEVVGRALGAALGWEALLGEPRWIEAAGIASTPNSSVPPTSIRIQWRTTNFDQSAAVRPRNRARA